MSLKRVMRPQSVKNPFLVVQFFTDLQWALPKSEFLWAKLRTEKFNSFEIFHEKIRKMNIHVQTVPERGDCGNTEFHIPIYRISH